MAKTNVNRHSTRFSTNNKD